MAEMMSLARQLRRSARVSTRRPSRSTVTRSASAITSSMRCEDVDDRDARARASCRTTRTASRTSADDSAEVGSSMIRMRARATAPWRFRPAAARRRAVRATAAFGIERRCPAGAAALRRPSRCARRSTIAPASSGSRPRKMLSAAVSSGTRFSSWWMMRDAGAFRVPHAAEARGRPRAGSRLRIRSARRRGSSSACSCRRRSRPSAHALRRSSNRSRHRATPPRRRRTWKFGQRRGRRSRALRADRSSQALRPRRGRPRILRSGAARPHPHRRPVPIFRREPRSDSSPERNTIAT